MLLFAFLAVYIAIALATAAFFRTTALVTARLEGSRREIR